MPNLLCHSSYESARLTENAHLSWTVELEQLTWQGHLLQVFILEQDSEVESKIARGEDDNSVVNAVSTGSYSKYSPYLSFTISIIVRVAWSFAKLTLEWNSTNTLLSAVNLDFLTKVLVILGILSTWFNFKHDLDI